VNTKTSSVAIEFAGPYIMIKVSCLPTIQTVGWPAKGFGLQTFATSLEEAVVKTV